MMAEEATSELDLGVPEEELAPAKFVVNLPVFEGPFDLLLRLIDEEKVNIHEVSLATITDKYLEHMKTTAELNIVTAAEFLLMAAYLLEMKSKRILPAEEKEAEKEEEIADVEKSLLDHLLEYRIFKGVAQELRQRKELFEKIYRRPPSAEEKKLAKDVVLVDVTLKDLVSAFQRVWTQAKKRQDVGEIVGEPVTVEEKMEEIMGKVKVAAEGLEFEKLFTEMVRIEVVVVFLAILELIRQKLIRIKQGNLFGSILIFSRE